MSNLEFIPGIEGLVTEESFLKALRNVGRVILTNSRNSTIVSGLEACRRITRGKKADVIFCTVEEDGSYFYCTDKREYKIEILN